MLSIVMFQAMIKEVILSSIQRKREKARRNKVFNAYVVMMYFSETWKIVLAIENHCNYAHYGKKSAPISFTSCTSFYVIASFAVLNAYFLHSFLCCISCSVSVCHFVDSWLFSVRFRCFQKCWEKKYLQKDRLYILERNFSSVWLVRRTTNYA